MNYDNLEYVDSAAVIESSTPYQPETDETKRDKRADSRFALVTQAIVSIPPLTSRVYQVREVSRGGIFLAFKERATTLLEMQKANVDTGAHAELAFAAPVAGQRQRFHVRARIARIARDGIGFQFLTRNPPQLAALRTLFSHGSVQLDDKIWERKGTARSGRRQTVERPSDDAGWQDWELIE